jgi:hypothetical protein
MRKIKSSLLKITKESPEARKKRVSSGVKFRHSVIPKIKKRDVPRNYDDTNF